MTEEIIWEKLYVKWVLHTIITKAALILRFVYTKEIEVELKNGADLKKKNPYARKTKPGYFQTLDYRCPLWVKYLQATFSFPDNCKKLIKRILSPDSLVFLPFILQGSDCRAILGFWIIVTAIRNNVSWTVPVNTQRQHWPNILSIDSTNNIKPKNPSFSLHYVLNGLNIHKESKFSLFSASYSL